MSDDERLDEIRRVVRETLQDIAPEAESLPPELRDPDKTTVWLRVITRDELERWLKFHRVTPNSRQRALEEYDIGKKNVTPKKFQIVSAGRTRFVKVTGSRRWALTRIARAEAEGESDE